MSIDSPNFEGFERWAVQPRRVEKPFGRRLDGARKGAEVPALPVPERACL